MYDFSVLFLIHLIVLHHYFLEVCFLRRDRKGADPDRRGGREKLGGVKGGETIIRIFCRKKVDFQKENEKRKCSPTTASGRGENKGNWRKPAGPLCFSASGLRSGRR